MTLRLLSSLILCLAIAVNANAQQLTATDVFKSAPARIFPLLENNTRLDMLDYFNSNMPNNTQNRLNGKSNITALSDDAITIKLSEASSCQLALLPAGNSQVIAVITTVATPAPDSKLTVYSGDWTQNLTAPAFRKPALRDWLTDEGRKHQSDVEMTVPFLLIEYSLDPSSGLLTLTNNTHRFLSEEVYEMVEPYLLKSIQYRWNGKRFDPVK